ncbi:MAG: hypothetical protein LBG92_05395 [Prevotellaceae bacterium]|jgi:hypothetical protein|nr:hypothetical protein [Prevotellaceae bacterium]
MDYLTQIIIALAGALFGGGLAVIATLKWAAKKAQFEAKKYRSRLCQKYDGNAS